MIWGNGVLDLPVAEEGREGKRPCAVPGPGVVSVTSVAASGCGRTSCCWGVPAAAQAPLLGCGKEAVPGRRDGEARGHVLSGHPWWLACLWCPHFQARRTVHGNVLGSPRSKLTWLEPSPQAPPPAAGVLNPRLVPPASRASSSNHSLSAVHLARLAVVAPI